MLVTDCLCCIGKCSITIISYSCPRFDVGSVHRHSLGDVRHGPCLHGLTCRRFGHVNGHTCPVIKDHPNGTVRAIEPFIRSTAPPSFVFFSLANAIGGLSLVQAMTAVSCVFYPVTTSHFVVRDSLGCTNIVGSALVAANGSGVGNVHLL